MAFVKLPSLGNLLARTTPRNTEDAMIDTNTTQVRFRNRIANTLATTSKQLIWFYSINGVGWVWASYYLAYIEKNQVLETLSSTVCNVVIGQLIVYFLSKTIENIFKYNVFGPKSANTEIDNGGQPPINDNTNIVQ